MYIESSAPRRPGDKARLVSPQVTLSGPQCLTFYYHMNGLHIGTLNVYTKTGTHLSTRPVWTKSLNQANKWIPAQVVFQSAQPVQIVFEGVVGQGFLGDIAIDDVSTKSGTCSMSGTFYVNKIILFLLLLLLLLLFL